MTDEQLSKFIKRIIDIERVWALQGPEDSAWSYSAIVSERRMIHFWSDKALALAAKELNSSWKEHEPIEIPLYNFLFRFLTGISNDGIFAGCNWNQSSVSENNPQLLSEQIIEKMPKELTDQYFKRLHYEQFIVEAVSNEQVWWIEGACSNAVDGSTVIMFWSSEQAALDIRNDYEDWQDYEVKPISLFDLLYRMLFSMSTKSILAGCNWPPDLTGPEVEAATLIEDLNDNLSRELDTAYKARFEDIRAAEKN